MPQLDGEHVTPLMWEIIKAAERMDGGGRECDLKRESGARGESGLYGAPAHFAKGIRQLKDRGILRREVVGAGTLWWLTASAWKGLGHSGPAPGSNQQGMF